MASLLSLGNWIRRGCCRSLHGPGWVCNSTATRCENTHAANDFGTSRKSTASNADRHGGTRSRLSMLHDTIELARSRNRCRVSELKLVARGEHICGHHPIDEIARSLDVIA